MVTLREQLIGMGEHTAVCRMEFAADTASEIDDLGDLIGRTIAPGSLIWDISTGDFYALDSNGSWINQTTGEPYVTPDPEPGPEDGEDNTEQE